MTIDFHSHAFADKIVDQAVNFLQKYYGISAGNRTGRLDGLIKAESKADCDKFVLLVAATKAMQVPPANDWAIMINRLSAAELASLSGIPNPPRPIVFGTLHPEYDMMQKEFIRLKAEGIRGLKIHPEFQGFSLDDRNMYPLYEIMEENFILLTHIGDKNFTENNPSTPKKLRKIMTDFPRLKIVAAHLGGYNCWEEALTELGGSEVYFDLSSTLDYINPSLLKSFIKIHGSDRLLYGSDYPLGDPMRELDLLKATGLFPGSLWDKITHRNAETLLKTYGYKI